MFNNRRNFDFLYQTLKDAQEKRPLFPALEWIDYELLTMLAATNLLIATKPRSDDTEPTLLLLDDIKSVERLARGHFDYTKKFALYCAELILDD